MNSLSTPPAESFAAMPGSASFEREPAVESGTRCGLVGVGGLLDTVQLGDNCDVLGTLPKECVDLVVTSPPYDDLRTYGGHSWDFFGLACQLKRVLKPGGVIVWVVGDATKDGSETGTSMEQALHFRRLGLRLHDTMIYETAKPPMNDRRYQSAFEFMFVLSKGAPTTWNPIKESCRYAGTNTGATYRETDGSLKPRHGGRQIGETKVRDNIWRFRSGNGADDSTAHPAAFPLALAKDHVASWSNPGDIVCDPFAGSGTTLKAAKELNRHWLGIEINPDYVEICRARLAQDVLMLFPTGGGGAEQAGDGNAETRSRAASHTEEICGDAGKALQPKDKTL